MEGVSTLLRVRTLTDVEGSPASTSGPSPRTALPGKGWRVAMALSIVRVITAGCLVLSAVIYVSLLLLFAPVALLAHTCECKAAAGRSPASAAVSAGAEEAPTRNANAQN